MFRRIIGGAALLVLAGCFTYEPARTAPNPGVQLAWEINDAGRVALGGTMGPEIARVEGRFIQMENTEYVVAVSSVQLLRGGEQTWKGERVRIKQDYVSAMYERKLSKGRSIAAVAITAGVVALAASKSSLIGLGGLDPAPGPSDTASAGRRPVRP